MRRKTVVVGIVVGIAAILLFAPTTTQLQAQSTLTLERLSQRVEALSSRLNILSNSSARKSDVTVLQRRVATLEAQVNGTQPTVTPTPTVTPRPTLTSTPMPPTATPVSASNIWQDMDVGEITHSLMVSDFRFDVSALENMTHSERGNLTQGYTLLFEYVTGYCGLSFASMAQLISDIADELDEIRFTTDEGIKPRLFLIAYMYGTFRDSTPGTYSCGDILELGRVAALSLAN